MINPLPPRKPNDEHTTGNSIDRESLGRSGEIESGDSSADTLFGVTDEALMAIAAVQEQSSNNFFATTLRDLSKAVSRSAEKSPALLKNVRIPKPEILYSTKSELLSPSYAGPVIVLLPEQHIMSGLDPFEEDHGLCPYAAKVQNCFLLRELFDDPGLGIQNTFHEFSFKLAADMQSDFDTVINNERVQAFNYASHLSRSRGKESLPAEDLEIEIQTPMARLLFSIIIDSEGRLQADKRAMGEDEIRTMINHMRLGDWEGLNRHIIGLVGTISHDLIQSDLTRDEKISLMERVVHRFQTAIEPYSYFSFDLENGRPNIDLARYAKIPVNVRRSFLNYLYSITDADSYARDEKMAENLQKAEGIAPMIIGTAHVPNLVKELENRGVPVAVIGSKQYLNMFDVDLHFKSNIQQRKTSAKALTQNKLQALRNSIAIHQL